MRKPLDSKGFGLLGVCFVFLALICVGFASVYAYHHHRQPKALSNNSASSKGSAQAGKTEQLIFPGSGLTITYNSAQWNAPSGGIDSAQSAYDCGTVLSDGLTNNHEFSVGISVGGCPQATGCNPNVGPCTGGSEVIGTVVLEGTTKYILAQSYTITGVLGTIYRIDLSDTANCTTVNCPLTIQGTSTDGNVVSGTFLAAPSPESVPTFSSLSAFASNASVQQAVQLLSTLTIK